ncbi:chemotaxis protein CheA [Sphingomonas solaris]|uniref:Chemotaxis protein CheA n=1 Tax=Alterirhizorhabdus solaris TaxID=2529389 RepID=A0A558QWT0_9SPHN|nr:chemotaxis protein CheA [Sphingomonas solaris]TVV71600.1 chemotaxis protein CheA [Sphingomonas solaris]
MDDLLQDFIAETREMLEAIAGEIVAWEADPSDRARLDGIFRFVHTVKGSCGFLDLPRLARLSHAAEDVLGELRAGERIADTRLVNAVLGVVDRIGALAEAIGAGTSLPDAEDHRLIAALHAPPAAAPDTPPEFPPEPQARAVARTVRLPIDLLDRMMGSVSDMVLARNELARRLREADAGTPLETAFERLSTCVAEMRDAITRTRMQRIDSVLSTLPRLVRDVAGETGKLVSLALEGGDVELDREMIEMIRDPLIHVLRNAIDHGIEPPEERRRLGKPATGRVRVEARQAGNHILILIYDDGRGIDGDRVAAKAVASGIITAAQAGTLDRRRKMELIFAPGLSTAETVTTLSGRGVGMDVVRANVERIGGQVEVDSRPGRGSRMTLRVPLTLSIIPALTLGAGDCHFAMPRAAIEEIVGTAGDRVRIETLGGSETATIRGRRLPLVRLGALMGLGEAEGAPGDAAGVPPILMLLRPAGGSVFALGVDAVYDHEELVVKPAAPAMMACGLYAGTALPDNGQPMLLLDPGGIARAAGVPLLPGDPEAAPDDVPVETVPALLFRDTDGTARGVRLAVVERVIEAPAAALVLRAGMMRLIHGGALLPLLACRPLDTPCATTVLLLTDGVTPFGYAIASPGDIREIDAAMMPAPSPGPVAGVVLVEGEAVELLDPFWLFAEAARAVPVPAGAVVALALRADQTDPWTREVLRPLIETAGYDVRFVAAGEPADLVIACEGAEPAVAAPSGCPAPVLRLRSGIDPDDDPESIWRYDREALLGAVRRRIGGGRA